MSVQIMQVDSVPAIPYFVDPDPVAGLKTVIASLKEFFKNLVPEKVVYAAMGRLSGKLYLP